MILHPNPPRPFKDKDRKGRRKISNKRDLFLFFFSCYHFAPQHLRTREHSWYPTSWGPLKAPCHLMGHISRATMVIHRRSTGGNGTLISSMLPSSSFPTPSFPFLTSQGDVGKLKDLHFPLELCPRFPPPWHREMNEIWGLSYNSENAQIRRIIWTFGCLSELRNLLRFLSDWQ